MKGSDSMHGTSGHMEEGGGGVERKSFLQPPRKRKETSLTADDALQILQSALRYCQQAKMPLSLSDSEAGATVIIGGVRVVVGNDGMARLKLADAAKI